MQCMAKDLHLYKIGLEHFKCIMVNQGRHIELDSEPVLHELSFHQQDWLKQSFEGIVLWQKKVYRSIMY